MHSQMCGRDDTHIENYLYLSAIREKRWEFLEIFKRGKFLVIPRKLAAIFLPPCGFAYVALLFSFR